MRSSPPNETDPVKNPPSELPVKGKLSWRSLLERFRALHLSTQFMILMSPIIIVLMSCLTLWASDRVERAMLAGAGGVGALYLETFVSPLIEEADISNDVINPVLASRLETLLGTGPLGQHVRTIKLWKADGSIFYSTNNQKIERPRVFDELKAALSGEIVVSRTEVDKHAYTGDEKQNLLIEVYAPLLRDKNGKIILVGEFYEEPNYLIGELRSAQRGTFLIVAAITLPMLGLLYLIALTASRLIVRQKHAIEANLLNALDLWEQNDKLRKAADYARLEAGKLNEKILDQIGNDLHDGPVQVLTLINLRLSDMVAEQRTSGKPVDKELEKLLRFVSSVLVDLRKISAGLALPELDELSLSETIKLAVARYRDLTAFPVEMDGLIPHEVYKPHLNVCVYRFIQEGLMNAFRHASSNKQKVRYRIHDNKLIVVVADLGERVVHTDQKAAARVKLGITSQRRRVRSFGGKMRVFRRLAGTIVVAVLPINQLSSPNTSE
ncbi:MULTISPECIES: sensor histidine kinase [Agrobacterium]|uniref:histidine kinase n=1 Tax=Agrobacterium tumefaciens TaxID=358 RepID=A0AAE6EI71_AGRTU|nr:MULTISPECIES: histidine kinase [Agrobacterium]QCL76880.1 ATP-binding protein [Agrobacterium tumefaciens]QCL82386.1 ATP-binding protein [Agrobacterium tumefaciens]CUX70609.1 Signal transduction histidine kinase [Agrobacterium sp. NCPPB 925]